MLNKADVNSAIPTYDIEQGTSVAEGKVSGTSYIHKFGYASDVDTSDDIVPVWDGSGVYSSGASRKYNFSSSADIDTISSSDDRDSQVVEVQGLDADYNFIEQEVTLVGQTKATLATPLVRVFRMKNLGSADIRGFVTFYVNTPASAGQPIDKTKSRAIINKDENQTLMAIYTVPAGYTGYITATSLDMQDRGDIRATVRLRTRVLGGVFQTKDKFNLSARGSSHMGTVIQPPTPISEKTDVLLDVEVSSNNSAVGARFTIILKEN